MGSGEDTEPTGRVSSDFAMTGCPCRNPDGVQSRAAMTRECVMRSAGWILTIAVLAVAGLTDRLHHP